MTITSDFNQFVKTYHKNNGSTNPLDERVIKQTRKDDIIYFDKDTNKFSYTKKLCVGLLPQDLEEDIAKMIHMYQFKKNIFIPVSPYFTLGKDALSHRSRYLRAKKDLGYMFPNHPLIDIGTYAGQCSCYTKKGTRCKSRATFFPIYSNSIGFTGYIPQKYDTHEEGYHPESINQTTHLCKTHSKMIRKNVSRPDWRADADRCYHEYYYENKLMKELGWNYKTHHGYLIKTK